MFRGQWKAPDKRAVDFNLSSSAVPPEAPRERADRGLRLEKRGLIFIRGDMASYNPKEPIPRRSYENH
jgi:hypothetical protein